MAADNVLTRPYSSYHHTSKQEDPKRIKPRLINDLTNTKIHGHPNLNNSSSSVASWARSLGLLLSCGGVVCERCWLCRRGRGPHSGWYPILHLCLVCTSHQDPPSSVNDHSFISGGCTSHAGSPCSILAILHGNLCIDLLSPRDGDLLCPLLAYLRVGTLVGTEGQSSSLHIHPYFL